MTHADSLRLWARGSYPRETATELLLRAFGGRFAAPGNPWIRVAAAPLGDNFRSTWIDFASIPSHTEGLSAEEKRVLLVATSLAENVPIALGDVVPYLERANLALVLAAIAHTRGIQDSDVCVNVDGKMTLAPGYLESLHPWPSDMPL